MFWTLFTIDAVVFAFLLCCFLVGLGDGSVNGSTIAIWLPLVGVPPAILYAGLRLRASARERRANIILALLAVPGGVVGGAFLLILLLFAISPGSHH